MTDNPHVSLKGQFLIAMPGLADPNFSQTVTCITEHNSSGALGIVINREHSLLSAKDIFEELSIKSSKNVESIPIHVGGPVHLSELFILHGPPFEWQGSLQVTPKLAMSNTRDVLEAISQGQGPTSFLISIGCAGWGESQLESELKANAWLTGPIAEEVIFSTPTATRWETALRHIGVDPLLLSGDFGHA